jgi:hypothetical protein
MAAEKAYVWEENYVAAILEIDKAKLQDRLAVASAAIDQRVKELSRENYGTPSERVAIADALRALAVLRQEESLLLQTDPP